MTAAPPTTFAPDLLYSEVEDDLRASVRAVLDRHSSWSSVLARTESSEPVDTALWARLAGDVGCAGLPVPEDRGGAGASWRETAVVAEELGRAVAPVPFLGSAVLATALLLACEPAHLPPDLLPGLAAGARVAAVAVPCDSMPLGSLPGAALQAVTVREGRLSGEVANVVDARTCDTLLVPTRDGLFVVDAADGRCIRRPVLSLDMTRPLVDLHLDGAQGSLLADGGQVARVLDAALLAGAVVLASEQVGTAQRCLDATLDHLRVRHQFARPLAGFQALKHRVADVWVALAQARAVARYAAAALAEGAPDLPVAASLAQAVCSEVAQTAAEECLQLHGGIGFTWEHPAHLYLKRAKASAITLGTPDRHRSALATLVDLPGPPAPGSQP